MMTSTPGRRGAAPLPAIDLPRIDGPEDAEAVCASIIDTMRILLELIEAETTLVRAGKLVAAGELEPRKSDYARRYLNDLNVLRLIGPKLWQYAPESVTELKGLHEEFRSLLQISMTALATAKAVSEGLIEAVAEGVGQKAPPKAYDRDGTVNDARIRARGLAVNRSL